MKNVTTGRVIAENVEKVSDWWRRLVGFIPKDEIGPDDGLWFDNCATIHTLGMRRPIDAVFLDKHRRVLKVQRAISQHRIAVTCIGAFAVVELGEATLEGRDLLVGDELALE
ncbi:MAG: DUF192 domain-containing protein [Candidatus Tumulicola sp.]